jgi:predicted nuclease with RNAse H fold
MGLRTIQLSAQDLRLIIRRIEESSRGMRELTLRGRQVAEIARRNCLAADEAYRLQVAAAYAAYEELRRQAELKRLLALKLQHQAAVARTLVYRQDREREQRRAKKLSSGNSSNEKLVSGDVRTTRRCNAWSFTCWSPW